MTTNSTLEALNRQSIEQDAAIAKAAEAVRSADADSAVLASSNNIHPVSGFVCVPLASAQKTIIGVPSSANSAPSLWTPSNAMTMSAAVLVFGLFVMYWTAHLIRQGRDDYAVLRVFGTILVVVSALFLVVAGYDDKQIAPVMGFLGTIAGYLLGREPRQGQSAIALTSDADRQ